MPMNGDGYGDESTTLESVRPFYLVMLRTERTVMIKKPCLSGKPRNLAMESTMTAIVPLMTKILALISIQPEYFYLDVDGDGFGIPILLSWHAKNQADRSSMLGDCDDGNADVHPDAIEICDEIDNDCDGLLDLADDSIDQNSGGVFYFDNDGDGFGSEDNICTCGLYSTRRVRSCVKRL